MSSSTYEWLKQLPSSFLNFSDQIPSGGLCPPFPWKFLVDELSRLFQLDHLDLKYKELNLLQGEGLFAGMGDSLIARHVKIMPLEGSACLVMPKEFISEIIKEMMKSSPQDVYDEDFQDAFLQFLCVEILHAIGLSDFDTGLSYQLLADKELPIEPSLCLDIDIVLSKKSLPIRLMISTELNAAWKERYSEKHLDLLLQSPLASKIPITVHLEAGKVELTQEELNALKIGDFIILDRCSMDVEEKKGRVMLTVNHCPFMRGKYREGKLKILETHVLEVEQAMQKEPPPEEYSEGYQEENEHSEYHEENEHSEYDEENEHSEYDEEGEHTEYDNEEGEKELEDFEFNEEEIDQEGEKVEEVSEEEMVKEEKPLAESFEKISPETLPMVVVVEMGRVEMSLQKLVELQPGSIIELDVTAQTGVDLVVNGKKIAKGELISIGETIGVRILDI